jgi:hypothetical protein
MLDDMRLQFAGESLLGRYPAADMIKRLAALEKLIPVLEDASEPAPR